MRANALLGRIIEMLIFEQRFEGKHLDTTIGENSGTSRARIRVKALRCEWQVLRSARKPLWLEQSKYQGNTRKCCHR